MVDIHTWANVIGESYLKTDLIVQSKLYFYKAQIRLTYPPFLEP
jgi:hypothetical protein